MADTLSTLGTMIGTDIASLRLTKIDTAAADSKYVRNDLTTGEQIIKTDLEINGKLTNNGIEVSNVEHNHNNIYPSLIRTKLATSIDIDSRLNAGGQSQLEVFENWYRFSHNNSGNYPASTDELDQWDYDADNDIIKCTINSTTYIGFISESKYTDFTLYSKITSTVSDNDRLGVVIAFYKDSETGREYTISAVRNNDNDTFTWKLILNYNQGSTYGERVLVDGTSFISRGNNWNSYPDGTTIKVQRAGNIIKAWSTQNDSTEILAESLLEINLEEANDLSIFMGPQSYGFSCLSQNDSTFKNIFIPEGINLLENYLFNLDTYETYELQTDGTYLNLQENLLNYIPDNTILNDVDTLFTYYKNGSINKLANNKRTYNNVIGILANSSFDLNLLSLGINGLKAIYDVKLLDQVTDSDTYDTYINSEAVCTISISKDGNSCKIINYDNIDQTFLINIQTI
jgi:hypothetical protein